MDFNLPEELQILKTTVGRFVDKELIPLEREYRPEGEEMPERLLRPLHEKVRPSDFGCSMYRRNTASRVWTF